MLFFKPAQTLAFFALFRQAEASRGEQEASVERESRATGWVRLRPSGRASRGLASARLKNAKTSALINITEA